MPDPELAAVTRAFLAAFKRECAAGTQHELQDELSNMLHHMYRLGELARRRWARAGSLKLDNHSFNLRVESAVPGAPGLLWIRTFDAHELAVTTDISDLFSDYMTEMFGVLAWQPLSSMPFATKDRDGWRDYEANLKGRPVLDSTRAAFDSLASML